MKAQHTPGPWDLGSTDARSRYNGIFDKSGNLLADVYQPFWRRGDRPDDPQHLTQVANAQLMCAAPELLEAAKLGLRAMRSLGWPEAQGLELQRWYETAFNAVKRAEGK